MNTNLSCQGPRENLTIKLLRYRKFGDGRFFRGIVPNPFQVGCPGLAGIGPRRAMLAPAHAVVRYAHGPVVAPSNVIEQPVPAVSKIDAPPRERQRDEFSADRATLSEALVMATAMGVASAPANSNNSRDLSPSEATHANSRSGSADGLGRLIDVLA